MIDNMRFNQVHVFHAIAQTGSIVGAAKLLGVSSPAVSKSLKLLEQFIGTPLFQRTTRKVVLTEKGAELLSQTQGLIQALSDAIEYVGDENTEPSGLVRLTLSKFAYHLILKNNMAEFCQRYPQIELEISVNDGMVDLMADGFDLGIRFGNTLAQGVIARELLPASKLGLYASKTYINQYGMPKNLEDLAKHHFVAYRFSSANRLSPLQLLVKGELTTLATQSIPLISNDIDVITDAILNGVGMGKMFSSNVARLPENVQSELIEIFPEYWQSYPPIYLYFLNNPKQTRPKRIQAVIDFLLEKMQ